MDWDTSLVEALDAESGQFLIASQEVLVAGQEVRGGVFSMSSHPHIHNNLSEAVTEAERLAGRNSNKRFVVLRVESVVQAVPVKQYDLKTSQNL